MKGEEVWGIGDGRRGNVLICKWANVQKLSCCRMWESYLSINLGVITHKAHFK